MTDGEQITERLKELLKARHMSRYRLTQLTGISQSSLCYLFQKKNVPGLVTLRKICDALGITLAQFFCERGVCILVMGTETVAGYPVIPAGRRAQAFMGLCRRPFRQG